MQAAVEIVDWAPGTPRQTRPKLRLVSETLTAGELIAERVAAECRALENAENLSLAELQQPWLRWLVVPGVDERALNGRRRLFGPGAAPADGTSDVQVAVARKAFSSGQFVMLFDGEQIENWDQRITIRDGSVATFIKMIPLRGG